MKIKKAIKVTTNPIPINRTLKQNTRTMKRAIIIILMTLFSCKQDPIPIYTLKVYFQDGTIDTLQVKGSYEIDKNQNLGSLRFGYYGTIATKVKYVKELNVKP